MEVSLAVSWGQHGASAPHRALPELPAAAAVNTEFGVMVRMIAYARVSLMREAAVGTPASFAMTFRIGSSSGVSAKPA